MVICHHSVKPCPTVGRSHHTKGTITWSTFNHGVELSHVYITGTQGRIAKGGSRGGPDPPNIMFVGKTWTSVGIFNVWI
jgi:hypothetical protein